MSETNKSHDLIPRIEKTAQEWQRDIDASILYAIDNPTEVDPVNGMLVFSSEEGDITDLSLMEGDYKDVPQAGFVIIRTALEAHAARRIASGSSSQVSVVREKLEVTPYIANLRNNYHTLTDLGSKALAQHDTETERVDLASVEVAGVKKRLCADFETAYFTKRESNHGRVPAITALILRTL